MPDVFNVEEILEIACRIEHNGARYYRRAAEILTDPGPSKLLLELAKMEDDHESIFAAMKTIVAQRRGELEELTDEARYYLKAFADGHVFPVDEDPAASLAEGVGLMDVLQKAMSMEKDSIAFYLGIREAMPPALGRDKVEMIIREEMRHVTILSDRMSAVAAAKE